MATASWLAPCPSPIARRGRTSRRRRGRRMRRHSPVPTGNPRMPLTAGTHFGPYEVVGPLAIGGMGEVYRARDNRLSRDAALKVLSAADRLDATRVARFAREARILSTLSHPNIATLFGFEESDGVQALAMELVD